MGCIATFKRGVVAVRAVGDPVALPHWHVIAWENCFPPGAVLTDEGKARATSAPG